MRRGVTVRRRPLVIAHRGASAVAPEGTQAAIEAAVRAGAHMIELDVQMTRDGRLVVLHDDRLNRTTNGRGRLTDARYADVARLDAGSWFHPRFARQRILLVSQAIRLTPPTVGLNLELKRTARARELRARLLRLLCRCAHRRLLLSSFDAALLRPFNGVALRRALICRRQPDRSLRQAIRLRCDAWHPFHTLVTPERIERAHAAGMRVHAWIVDDLPRARRLIRMGADGIFTNDPARLVGLFRSPR